MNLLFLDSWLRDRATGSGSAVAIAGLARGLADLGHEVNVLRPHIDLGSLDLTRWFYNVTLRRRIERLAERFDVVVGIDFDGWALPHDLPTRLGLSYVVALKGVAAEEAKFETGLSRLRFEAIRRLEGRNARKARRVFVTSDYAAQAAIDAYDLDPGHVRIAPEALDDAVRERAAAAHVASRAGAKRFHAPGPTVLSVARQYPRKDTPTLLRAFARVVARLPEARLRIVGDGPELSANRRLATELKVQDRVVFTGALASTDALDAEYRGARVFCLPSRQEGFGIVFLEAMAYGLPIAAAAAGAVPEVAPDGETSILVPAGDEAALADALERLLTDPDMAARLGEAGAARAARFDWTSSARAFLEGFDD